MSSLKRNNSTLDVRSNSDENVTRALNRDKTWFLNQWLVAVLGIFMLGSIG
jgi:hypothetical protein